MNVLINAYAVSPSWGSEQGMGWNWVIHIARYCNVFVITEGQWRKEIEYVLPILPQKDNIHFYYNPVSERVRKMCWNQGDWRFYLHYRKWQKKTLKIAYDIMEEFNIDIIHQLNMVGFREPVFLWRIRNVPFVWGPVCIIENVPLSLTRNFPLNQRLTILVKNVITCLQIHFSYRVFRAIDSSSTVIAATKMALSRLILYKNETDVSFINETGIGVGRSSDRTTHDFDSDELNIIWVGRFLNTKKLDLALESISLLKDLNVSLTVVGGGTPDEMDHYKRMASSLDIDRMVTWLGMIPHESMGPLMAKAHLLFFTSISEATSTVVPEAISCNLPIVCFNICGFGPLVKDNVGETVEVTDQRQSAMCFAEKIRDLYNHRDKLKRFSLACDRLKDELTYDHKAKKVIEIYKNALASFSLK